MSAKKSSNTKRKTATKSGTRKNTVKSKSMPKNQGNYQVGAIILFAIGLFVTALAFIKGQNVWAAVHTFLFGLFGLPAMFVGIIIMFVAILFSSGRAGEKLKHKIWQLTILFSLVCALAEVIYFVPVSSQTIGTQILNSYNQGTRVKGGGILGGIIGIPLESALGNTAAIVLISILLFMLLLIITGATLIGFLRGVSRPVRKIESGAREHYKLKQENRKKFNIDIPLEDTLPAHPVSSRKKFFVPNIEETETKNKRKKLKDIEKKEPATQEEKTALENQNHSPELDKMVEKATQPRKEDVSLSVQTQLPAGKEAVNASDSIGIEQGSQYIFPPVSFLKPPIGASNQDVSAELHANADRLVDTLKSFGVETRIIHICRGPSVTRYELQPSAGVKISKITNLADDIALNLAAGGVRIEAPIPNKAAVGIEVPNKKKEMVTLREIVDSKEFKNAGSQLTFALGRDIAGNVALADIAKMPHMLIAGSTGSGKSVCINSMIISLLYKSSPDDLRLLMIDPKVVELGVYNGIPHLLVPVVTDPKKAAGALGWAVTEMLNRYKLFAAAGVRDLNGYNAMAVKKAANGEEISTMPQIVIIIDELADLMMAASREVEDSICRLAQMARAAGMHLVIATQRPSVDVITGVIKANIPSRIAFTVSSQVDSRTILDSAGAEKLLGKGDMLFNPVGCQKPIRIQGCFVSDGEVEQVISYIKEKEEADYNDDILEEIERQAVTEQSKSSGQSDDENQDPMLSSAIECVVEAGQASTSFLQRRLKLGYARAARIMDEMETRGIVGQQEGSKPREVLITKQQWLEMSLNSNAQDEES